MDLSKAKQVADEARAKVDAARKVVDALAGTVESFPWVGGYAKLLHLAIDGVDDAVDVIDDTIDKAAASAPAATTP